MLHHFGERRPVLQMKANSSIQVSMSYVFAGLTGPGKVYGANTVKGLGLPVRASTHIKRTPHSFTAFPVSLQQGNE